jgi:hypothetical protein
MDWADKRIWTGIITIIFLIAVFHTWSNTKYPYMELWVVDCPIIRDPEGKTHIEKIKPAIEFFELMESQKRIGTWHANRKFNSGIIYTYSKNRETLDSLEKILRESSPIDFTRILGEDLGNEIKEAYTKELKILIGCYVLALTILLCKIKHKLLSIYLLATILTILVNAHSRSKLRWQQQLETKVVNNIAPPGSSFGHRHAENLLKSHTGEVAVEILRRQGHRSNFRIRNAVDVFEKSTTKKKADSLWIRSTAKENEIAKAKHQAETLVKAAAKKEPNEQ